MKIAGDLSLSLTSRKDHNPDSSIASGMDNDSIVSDAFQWLTPRKIAKCKEPILHLNIDDKQTANVVLSWKTKNYIWDVGVMS